MSKPQIPNKSQFPMTQWALVIGLWTLDLDWDLGFGYWDLAALSVGSGLIPTTPLRRRWERWLGLSLLRAPHRHPPRPASAQSSRNPDRCDKPGRSWFALWPPPPPESRRPKPADRWP